MAVDDIDILKSELPEVFEGIPAPQGWEDDWLIVSIDEIEGASGPLEEDMSSLFGSPIGHPDHEVERVTVRPPSSPDFGANNWFPGAPLIWSEYHEPPPPDACAFYLPFHYFHPTWWGIYLVAERILDIGEYLFQKSRGSLTEKEAIRAARIFAYGHEAFHHLVESFATRLEVSHRIPLYKKGFAQAFRRSLGTDKCLEEGLATAHGIRRARAFSFPKDKQKTSALLNALLAYAGNLPPGYRLAPKFVKTSKFVEARNVLAELYLRESLQVRAKHQSLWQTFPHAFSGISRITSRVNYIVRRGSPLATRLNVGGHYLRYRDLKEKLIELANCKVVREGKGSHEIWQAPSGKRFPIARHPGDVPSGTLAKIIKQAGLDMSVSEFIGVHI